MADIQQVPVTGFNAPPAQAPQVPALQVPTNGPPALPQPNGNGEAHQYVGQVPGFVPQGQQQNPQVPPAGPAAQQPPVDVSAIIAAALAAQNKAPEPTQAPAEQKPSWLSNANTFDVSKVEDPIIASMASILQTVGKDLDLDRVLGNAMFHGDPNLVDVAYISERGGANAAQIAQLAKGIVQAVDAKSNAITAEVHTMAGGAAQWSQATDIFNKTAPPELRETAKFMMNSTNPAFIKAAAKIVTDFSKNSGMLPNPGNGLLNTAAGGTGASNGLTKVQFQQELQKLDPNSADYSAVRDNLFARRQVGKRAGL